MKILLSGWLLGVFVLPSAGVLWWCWLALPVVVIPALLLHWLISPR